MAVFSGKRGLHIVANVGVVATFTGKRGIHAITNVYSVPVPPPPAPGSGVDTFGLPVGSIDVPVPTGNWSILGVVMDGYTLGVRP